MEALQISMEDIEPITFNCRSTKGNELIGAQRDTCAYSREKWSEATVVKAPFRATRKARLAWTPYHQFAFVRSSTQHRSSMCFDDRTGYTTRTRVENGVRFKEEVIVPRHRSGWRRRYGAHYYPSRYYARPPHGQYVGSGMPYPARYPANVGYPRAVATTATVPRGYVHSAGGYMSGARALMPSSHNMVSVTKLYLLSFVWSSSRLPVLRRLSTCGG
jgi:hypothetical protein